jgi:hypothetical protein
MRPPILVRCEGSGCPPCARELERNQGLCSCCGEVVACDQLGRCEEHQRQDLLAMLERGDFG